MLAFSAPSLSLVTRVKRKKWLGVLPRHLEHEAEELERVLEVLNPRAAPHPARKCVTLFLPRASWYTVLRILPLLFSGDTK